MLLPALLTLAACGDNTRVAAQPEAGTSDDAQTGCTPVRGTTIAMRLIGQIPGIAVLAASPPDDPRLFVVMREGQIRIFRDEVLVPEPFIDLAGVINTEETVERGLLGLAFHPRYATNRQFFVFYTTLVHGVVARCTASSTDPDRAEPACTIVIEILHNTAGNHNGGMIEFGSDGYLYIGTGDGGGAGDPNRRAQNPDDLLGKILRVDVDARANGMQYGIPPTNPYSGGGGRPEVFIRGVRNPWRFSFDRATGDLWIGDVGQNRAEEMTVLRPSQQNGANLGWSLYEGNSCCATQDDECLQLEPLPCDPAGITFPQDVRDRQTAHGLGWASIVTGQTYRGTCYPDLVGTHFYTDVYNPVLVKARLLPDDTLELTDTPDFILDQPSSLHADGRGEIYVTTTDGKVYHLEARP